MIFRLFSSSAPVDVDRRQHKLALEMVQRVIAKRRICARRRINPMTTTKFVVRVNRGTRVPEYVQRIGRTPIQTTTNRKLALIMGRFTAEDAIKSIQSARCRPELVFVQIRA